MKTDTEQIATFQQVQFAKALNFLLAQKGDLDTKALAAKAGMTQRTVNYAKGGGKRSGVSVRSAEKIAAALDLSYRQILELGERIMAGEDGAAALAEIRAGVPVVAAQIAVANGDGNQVANSVTLPAPPASGGDIARELCGLIAEHLEGKNMDEQIAFRAKVKRCMDEE